MKFCRYCGNSIDENAIFCPSCGARVSGDNPRVNNNPFNMYNPGHTVSYDNEGSKLIAFISFLCWEAGLVIWFLWRYSHPGKARSAAKGALANACFGMPVLGFVLWLILREDVTKREYAKVCGVAAIVGASFYALSIVCLIVLKIIGIELFTTLPLDGMAATVLSIIR